MSTEESTRLFRYISDRFDSIDRSLESKAEAADVRKVLSVLDGMVASQELDHDERLVMSHQLERLDGWVHQVAEKIDCKLTT